MSHPRLSTIFKHEITRSRGPVLRTFTAYLPALLWAATVLTIGSLTRVPTPDTTLPIDKAAHFAMYGVLGALCAWGWLRTGRMHSAILVAFLAIAVGGADELHQRTVQGRSSDVKDWVADIAGVAVGFTLVSRRGNRTALGEQQA